MSNDNHVTLEDEFLEAARELGIIKLQRAELDQREAACKELLAKVLATGEIGISPDGYPLAQVKHGAKVWNEDKARQVLTPAQVAALEVTETKLDRVRAKDTLAPAIFEACCRENKPSVVAL